jgi:CRISPR-associated protein Cmr3
MRLFIIPAEPLLFRRTGRSFSAGESGYADTLFPPTPETLQGAIRAAIATHWDSTLTLAEVFKEKELLDLIGDRAGYGRFRITGIALGRRADDGTIERLFPAPAFLQRDENKQIVYLGPKKLTGTHSNMPAEMFYLQPDQEIEGKLKPAGWLTERDLLKTLRGDDLQEEDIVKDDDIRTFEPRLGIGMNNQTKTTVEGLLYQTRMVRMNHTIESEYIYGFVVDVRLAQSSEDTDQLIDDRQTRKLLRLSEKSGWITLGGERRAARFEIVDIPEAAEPLEQAKQGKLLYIATPAGFKEGWKPVNWQPTGWSRPLPPPVAAAIDHYQSIGGWLLTPGSMGGENKPILRCVPAGSVYFFDKPVTVTQPFTDHGWQIGYGIAYAGDWKQ